MVSGLSSTNTAAPAQSLRAPAEIRAKASGEAGASGDSQRESARISRSGQLLAQLHQLQSQDPAKFKAVVSGIATQLQTAAQQQGQSSEGQLLARLADKFQKVAAGDDLSQLQPPRHDNPIQQKYSQFSPQTLPVQDVGKDEAVGADYRKLFTRITQDVLRAASGG